jgi:ANTAR domain-containing protein
MGGWIGMLAERFVLPFAEAFEVIRAAARNSRREVRAVAEELRASRETPLAITEVLPPGADPIPRSEGEPAEDLRCPRCGTLVSY